MSRILVGLGLGYFLGFSVSTYLAKVDRTMERAPIQTERAETDNYREDIRAIKAGVGRLERKFAAMAEAARAESKR